MGKVAWRALDRGPLGIPTQFLGLPKGAVHTHHLAPLSLPTALWFPTHLKPQSM